MLKTIERPAVTVVGMNIRATPPPVGIPLPVKKR